MGYGRLIEERRNLVPGMSREELGKRLGRSASTIQRFELESGGPPNREQVNALVAALPLTAEELLSAMGYHMNPPAALRVIPRQLVDLLMAMTPAQHQLVIDLVTKLQMESHPSAKARK